MLMKLTCAKDTIKGFGFSCLLNLNLHGNEIRVRWRRDFFAFVRLIMKRGINTNKKVYFRKFSSWSCEYS